MTRLADDSSEVVDKILDVGQVCKERLGVVYMCILQALHCIIVTPLEKL